MNIKVILGVLLLGLGIGYGLAVLQHRHSIAGYDAREQANQTKIKANEAEQVKLRGENENIRTENDGLRKDIAEKSASEEALQQIIKEHGGAIATEGQKLEQINEQLKTDTGVLVAPTDRCTRCRRFSTTALAAKLIAKPLTCADECAGSNR